MSAVEVTHRIDGRDDAPPLLLSNSLGSTTAMWDPQVPALAERFRVVRYDHRGHGAAPVPDGPYALDDLGADAVALLDRLGIERAHVCGLSLGGMVGMWLAINAPERVDRLVVCCTSAMLADDHDWADRAAKVRAGGLEAVADAVVGRWLTPGHAAAHSDLAAGLRAMLCDTPPEGYAACCDAIRTMDLIPQLGAVRSPSLIVAGAQDEATRPVHAERIAALIPGCRMEVVDAAHLANVERPDEVTALILSHLDPAAEERS
jgi:3-oxoadipate enol-lactonase